MDTHGMAAVRLTAARPQAAARRLVPPSFCMARPVKTKGIRTTNIILSTLNQVNVPEPDEYIKQICFESAAFLPVYYFIKKAGMTLDHCCPAKG